MFYVEGTLAILLDWNKVLWDMWHFVWLCNGFIDNKVYVIGYFLHIRHTNPFYVASQYYVCRCPSSGLSVGRSVTLYMGCTLVPPGEYD